MHERQQGCGNNWARRKTEAQTEMPVEVNWSQAFHFLRLLCKYHSIDLVSGGEWIKKTRQLLSPTSCAWTAGWLRNIGVLGGYVPLRCQGKQGLSGCEGIPALLLQAWFPGWSCISNSSQEQVSAWKQRQKFLFYLYLCERRPDRSPGNPLHQDALTWIKSGFK